MPPKSDYWRYFVVQGVLAICQIEGCPKPNVSLGSVPKPGQKKRISEYIFYTTAALYHNAFFQQPVQSQTTWSSITRQSGTPTLKPEQGRLRWRPRSSRRWRSPARWTTLKCASTMWGQARVVFLFWTRWAAVRLIFHLFVFLLFRSCNIHGSWEAIQCSRTDYAFKEEQIVTCICWQAALPLRGSPIGHLQTWLEVKSYVVSPLDCICEWNKCTFNCT